MMTQPPLRRRHRGLRALLITLIVLAILLVAADRVGAYVGEQVAADTIKSSQHLDHTPDVDVAGFPFLTQLAAGDFDQITITADDVPVGDQDHPLSIDRVHVDLHSVHVARDFHSVRADTAQATGTVSYAQLSRAVGIDVSYAGDNRIKASKKITVLGRTVTPTVSVEPRIVNGALAFGSPVIDGLSQLGSAAADVLKRIFDVDIPLADLPFDVHVRSVQVDKSGVTILLTGTNITYSRN